MKVRLDGMAEFEQIQLQEGSWDRAEIERSVNGLDGVVSVDGGLRKRPLIQAGLLRAFSAASLRQKLEEVQSFADGGVHRLSLSDGRSFDSVRIDRFTAEEPVYDGAGVSVGFEIRYSQTEDA